MAESTKLNDDGNALCYRQLELAAGGSVAFQDVAEWNLGYHSWNVPDRGTEGTASYMWQARMRKSEQASTALTCLLTNIPEEATRISAWKIPPWLKHSQ
jgi:hypothetical protein